MTNLVHPVFGLRFFELVVNSESLSSKTFLLPGEEMSNSPRYL